MDWDGGARRGADMPDGALLRSVTSAFLQTPRADGRFVQSRSGFSLCAETAKGAGPIRVSLRKLEVWIANGGGVPPSPSSATRFQFFLLSLFDPFYLDLALSRNCLFLFLLPFSHFLLCQNKILGVRTKLSVEATANTPANHF